ncbi:E3 ubiquitin-protein ligase rad18 [Orbilia oligospora]|uniref:Postreplication repair E3 ubiquitin-protein ligase RAD18 n=1 Tax=Orbilia oligospora TaxID=2813651 RepID=A0A8H2E703_ORBOL|nr:E3 ubiquitin-protein ligase rad18 [Orbilia oligospora]KAF3249022.1 E3 ubiquitin-protein ligase rad18 [Orbilia oligospora]KAF3262088.1 E3 ubiquitin-protein ligase rad18 [Orbilia oligospora]KAF3290635.1 E3 ubiquitin-protein ligase rad18 [Orbilia oligospora]TGJ72083.1 E3 ubiquitin-protein ligase rad18 [Orbilia oligospora]
MDADFPDPTDWIQTPVPGLQALETSLRCQVCKELFTAPKVTTCGHTFCSLCIRRCLSASSKCPTCMKPDEEPRLRDNIVVSELVSSFNTIRKSLLDTLVAKEEARKQAEEEAERDARTRLKAEKRSSYDLDDDEVMEDAEPVHRSQAKKRRRQDTTTLRKPQETEPPRRSTRTSSQRTNSRAGSSQIIAIPDSDDDDDDFQPIEESSESEFQSSSRAKRKSTSRAPDTPTKDSDLFACPLCNRRKDQSTINPHVNRCIEGNRSPSPTPGPANGASSAGTPLRRQPATFSNLSRSQHRAPYTVEEREKLRLPKGNASLAKEADIRKKLRDHGIRCDVKGKETKQSLWTRLQEWTNLWNANLDSDNPKLKHVLIKELEAYERSQATQKHSVVQDKDFEREAWSNAHKPGFDALIANARNTVSRKKENGTETEATSELSNSAAGAKAELNGIDSPEVVEV